MDQIALALFALVLALVYFVAVPALLIVLLVRTQRLKAVERQLRQLEGFVRTQLVRLFCF